MTEATARSSWPKDSPALRLREAGMMHADQSLRISAIQADDALDYLITELRGTQRHDLANYGYDVDLTAVINRYLRQKYRIRDWATPDQVRMLSPSFCAASWELCRRGILRPGVRAIGEQSTEQGNAGAGFALTPYGATWLTVPSLHEVLPYASSRFGQTLDSFTPRFGAAYRERSQEAMRCYDALAFIACCAMTGAAAESIILALAVEKDGDQEKVEKEYLANGGRGRIENKLIGSQPDPVKAEFKNYVNLMKYWRDSAAHGRASGLTENDAYMGLIQLLRFAQFARDRWDQLTQQ